MKVITVVIIVILVIAIVGGVLIITSSHHQPSTFPSSTSSFTNTTTVSSVSVLQPSNKSVLVDVAQTAAPSGLDPATDFLDQVEPLYYAVYQELVEPNGSNYLQVVPVIAQNWTTTNYENWTFYLRTYVTFSDGNQVNASSVWFSLYRTILMGQPPGVADYICLLFNSTQYGQTGYALPWGVANAIQQVTGLP
ncbi:peptide ABC transporter permease, partial [Sulfolobus sp. B5]